jgi:hypothetical protein
MENRWNEIDRGKPKQSGKNLCQWHFVHHKSHMDWPGIEPGPPIEFFKTIIKVSFYTELYTRQLHYNLRIYTRVISST